MNLYGPKRLTAISLSSVIALSVAFPAFSQEQGEDEAEIEEVVVTIERRAQSLQSFAGTAANFSGEDLKSLGVQNITDLNGKLPGLAIGNNQGNIEIFIRGIGNENNTEIGLPRVATLLDGVFVPRPRGFGSVFFDIERVEVNVGPQGTIRGRNATGGTVNVVPFRPGLRQWDAAVEVGYGNFNQATAEAVLNVPVGDTMAFRFAASYLNHDSYMNNVGPVSTVDVAEAEDNFAFRGSFYWEPNDRFSAYITGDFLREDGTGFTGTNFALPVGIGIDIDTIEDPRAVIGRAFTPQLDTNHFGAKGTFIYDFDAFSIEYTGGFRSLIYDFTAATPLSPDFPGVLDELEPLIESLDNFSFFQSITDSDSMTHELRIFRDEGPLLFSAGLNYFTENQSTFLGSTSDRTTFFSGQEFNLPIADRESFAGFVDATYEVTDKLRITGGIRFTDEELTRAGTNATYGFALGGAGFSCCLGVRIGTEGFEFAGTNRTIFNPDTDGSGTLVDQEILDFFFNGVAQFGLRDDVDDIFANGPVFGGAPVETLPPCVDTITTDDLFCDPSGNLLFAVPFPDQIFIQNGAIAEEFISWRARIEYDFLENSLAYFSVSRAQNAGGFNDNVPGTAGLGTFNIAGVTETAFATDTLAPEFGFETLTSYEVGIKNEFDFDDFSLKLNVTGFFYDYDDQQLTTLTSVAGIVDALGLDGDVTLPPGVGTQIVSFTFNAEDTRVFGAQVDGGLRIPFNLNLDWQFLYLNTEIVNSIEIDDARTVPVDLTNIEGNELTRSPRFSVTGNLSQSFEVPTGRVEWVASAGWRGSQFLTIFNSELDVGNTDAGQILSPAGADDTVEPYLQLDFGAKYVHGDGRFTWEAFVNNATNQEQESAIINTPFDNTRFFTRPRTFGLRLRVKLNS